MTDAFAGCCSKGEFAADDAYGDHIEHGQDSQPYDERKVQHSGDHDIGIMNKPDQFSRSKRMRR